MDSSWAHSLGVALAGPRAPRRATDWARAAEEAGLGSLWLIEDYFHPGAFTLAGAAAAVTGRIAIGLGVANPYTRHPALLAMEAAALGGAAPGRAVLGLGTSNRRWIEDQMGIDFKAPLAGLAESVSIVRRLLRGERVTAHGARFHLDGVQLEWAPPEEMPIVLGVKGPRALRLAGEIADGVICSVLASPAHVRRVRRTAGAGRRDFAVVAYAVLAIDDDGARARAQVRPLLAAYLGALHGQSILADADLGPDRTRPFREAMLRGEDAAGLVTDAIVETLAVAGTPAECRRQLARWAEAGLDAPIAVVPGGLDLATQIARIGRELGPAWREMRWP
ncbi:MAG TPA: LLM class flavin-dependent oxidoreductase [Candidatus Methylomirabilis sp.]|nr:LLM class flavin-dependent oxidoreductase [Candidatus Methylomirabilis sp.]